MNSLSPLVSVVIPTFNRREELCCAIESALNQTMGELEIVVCDDGSTDDTEDAVRDFALRDCRVRYCSGPRSGGASVPRNRGARLAKGRWIAFLDSDDRWMPTKLASQLAALEDAGAAACCANAYRVVDWAASESGVRFFSSVTRPTLASLIRSNTVITSSVVVDRECFIACAGFPESPAFAAIEDYAFWLRVAESGAWACVDAPLLWYKDNPATSFRGTAVRTEFEKIGLVFADYMRWRAERGTHITVSTAGLMAWRLAKESIKDKLRSKVALATSRR